MLKQWRESQDLTQAELAALLSVDVMTVSRWERETRAIPPYLNLALQQIQQQRATAEKPDDRNPEPDSKSADDSEDDLAATEKPSVSAKSRVSAKKLTTKAAGDEGPADEPKRSASKRSPSKKAIKKTEKK